MPLFTDAIKKRLDAVRLLRRQIAEMADNSAEDVERKALMLRNAEEQTQRLAYAANFLLVACWEATTETDREERLKQALTHVEFNFKELPVGQLEAEGNERLQRAGCPMPFHWALEFPEVFMQRGGFDAIVGNPPFMGGQKITGNLGNEYREYLVSQLAGGKRGSADLCSYFFLRATGLLRETGQFGLLATNTIAQGDTREVGLDQLAAAGCVIPRAVPSRPWPGVASLEVAHVWVHRGEWKGPFVLDEKATDGITAFLTPPGAVAGKPHRLKANEGKSFIGSYVLGMGFVLTPEEAQRLIEKDARNKEVLFPYLNGEDLNSRPDQSPSRWVINFFDWPIEKAMQYPDCFRIVEEKVKPERMKNNRKVYRDRWWHYAEKRPELYRTISGLERVLVKSEVGNKLSFAFVPNGWVYSHMLILFAFDDNCCTWQYFSQRFMKYGLGSMGHLCGQISGIHLLIASRPSRGLSLICHVLNRRERSMTHFGVTLRSRTSKD